MLHVVDKWVYGMAGLRLLSSLVEMSGAMLMLYYGTAAKALQVNAALAFVGPLVLVTVTLLGVAGIASNDMHWGRIACILFGVGCILFGARGL
ncbi:MAG: YqhV family protein [Alicyclobacillus sp.]|nr:YqhV family protein [Alicyclobacillus sp.]